MAHFARMANDVVQDVIVVANAALNDAAFPESEPIGQSLLAEWGFEGTYLQCSYSGSFRGAYPGPGWRYDSENDEFVGPDERMGTET